VKLRLNREADREGIDEKSLDKTIVVVLLLSKGAKARRRILRALLPESKSCSQIAREVKLNWRTVY